MGTGQPAGKRRRGWRWLLIVPFVLALFSVLQVLVLRFVDPPFSMVMAADQAGRWIHGPDRSLVAYDWVDHGQMAACLPISLSRASTPPIKSRSWGRGNDTNSAELLSLLLSR